MFAFCHEASVTCTQLDLGLPTDVLDHLGVFFEPQLQMPAHLGGIALGPGAFDQSPSGMGVAGLRNRSLLAPLPGGVFRGDQPQKFHECSWGIETAEIANVSHQSNGHGALHATQRLKGFTRRGQAPRFHVILQCLIEPLESFGMLIDGTDLFLKNDVLCWCRADHFREPPEMSRAPVGPAGGAAIVAGARTL